MAFNRDNVKQILKNVHPQLQLTLDAYTYINDILIHLLIKLLNNANNIYFYDDNYNYMYTIISGIIEGEFAEEIINEWNNYVKRKYPLIYSLKSINYIISKRANRIYDEHNIVDFISVIFEYITLKILNVAGNMAKIDNMKRINYYYIDEVVGRDRELNDLVSKVFN